LRFKGIVCEGYGFWGFASDWVVQAGRKSGAGAPHSKRGKVMSGLAAFTIFHVLLSLIGIATGFIVIFGLIAGRWLGLGVSIFLWTTILTSVTGFFFPFKGITPGIILGIISLVVLALSLFALYGKKMAGGWRTTFVITAVVAQWLNFFVLIAQLFEKVPALHALAPTNTEAPFKIAQLTALIVFVVLGFLATKNFRHAQLQTA
jgi:MFS family permease